MLNYLKKHADVYDHLETLGRTLVKEPMPGVSVNRVGSMFTFFFQEGEVTDYETAKRSDTKRFAKFFHWMIDRGVYLAPSQFEAGFLSAGHTLDDINYTVETAREFFAAEPR